MKSDKRHIVGRNIIFGNRKYVLICLEPSAWDMIDTVAKIKGISSNDWLKQVVTDFKGPGSRTMAIREAAQTQLVEEIKRREFVGSDEYVQQTLVGCIEKLLIRGIGGSGNSAVTPS